jgi:PAS domain S-box-containing protein
MGEKEDEPLVLEPQHVLGSTFDNSERLLQAFSQASAIGFAILDDQLRYQGINHCLANINGIPAEAHLGFGVRELFGELSEKIAEPTYHRVLERGETSQFEVKDAALPNRPESRYWALNINFPIRKCAGRVNEIGIVVIDVTEQRRLQEFVAKLPPELRHLRTKEMFWQARQLRDSIDDYHAALAFSLEFLVRGERSTEQLAQSIEVLDQGIMAMRKLVSSTAAGFPIDR